GPATEVYAVDAGVDRLLVEVAGRRDMLGLSVGKTVSGRLRAPSREAAFQALAATVGFDARPPRFKGRGASVSLSFANAPGMDLLRVLADVGRFNTVIRGTLPDFNIVAPRAPIDGVLANLLVVAKRTMETHGNMRYFLSPGEQLPALKKLKSADLITLDAKGATVGEVVAALRAVTSFPDGACANDRFSLRLTRAAPQELARALAFVSDTALAPGTSCAMLPAVSPNLTTDKLVAIVSATPPRGGVPRRAAVFVNTHGSYVVRGTDALKPAIEIGNSWVTIGTDSAQLHPPLTPPGAVVPDDRQSWVATLRRTSALFKYGTSWTAFVETLVGLHRVDPTDRYSLEFEMPAGVKPVVALDGVRFTSADPAVTPSVHVPFGR
ncbi:MAG: hypothetical protein H0T79_07300, partial [Deltaproteobacteria bacterium]|nr:hypothetical protein [Deltaproteobacteria bacterium]